MTDTARDQLAEQLGPQEEDSFSKLTVQRWQRITEITPHGVRYRFHSWYEEPGESDPGSEVQ
jgi:hypothetical protein